MAGIFYHFQKDRLIFPMGFTLLELIVVILVIAVGAALAITSYGKTMERSKEREAVGYLRGIHAAMQNHFVEYSAYPLPGEADTNEEINDVLGTNLPPSGEGLEFICDSKTAPEVASYTCQAFHPDTTSPDWVIENKSDFCFGKPYCESGNCPSLPDQATSGCDENT